MTAFEDDLDTLASGLNAHFDESGCNCPYIVSVIWQRNTFSNPTYRFQHAPDCPYLTNPAPVSEPEPEPEPEQKLDPDRPPEIVDKGWTGQPVDPNDGPAPEPEPEPKPKPKKTPAKRAPRKKLTNDESETS